MEKTISFLVSPEESYPINATGGLYMQILCREGRLSRSEIAVFCEPVATKHGWNAAGRVTVGAPCSHGIQSVSYAIWFHDKR